ncbi:glycosyltransferase [Azospirillum brasilense]|uniref:glycosyltransferase n=1 Tax=Azospirillum brasilense TaxID=192 RepID=UPI000E6868EF|nr:glycosyltransferase [Azospirillum brasilense]NUB28214.1 hypothetical protein [Azospirillum brasilense]NUB35509.1 hypothetical protein [Azospirillum brasilense]RIV97298.1 hypothetical protein D2T81_29160 [Azospirillum brasilense]
MKMMEDGGLIGVMVGDFRFGNSIFFKGGDSPDTVMQDGFLGIDIRAMTLEHDRKMLARGMAALKIWHQTFGNSARYIFWDLFGRQVHDRMGGRHISEGRYKHPAFTYEDVVASLPDLDIVDLSPLLKMPMHEVMRLFIDGSNHPSQIGYLLLNNLLCGGLGAAEAYARAVSDVETELFSLAGRAAETKGGKVLLTGRSVWLDTLVRCMGAEGNARLADAGVLLAPLDRAPGQRSIAEITKGICLAECPTIIVSASGSDLAPVLARGFANETAAWNHIPHIDWESATNTTIVARGETPRFAHGGADRPQAQEVILLELDAHMVEQGPLGMPSWTGLRHILECIASDKVPTAFPRRQSAPAVSRPPAIHSVTGDALLTDAGVAFLIGGNHSVLKFVTGELVPSRESLMSFSNNISGRIEVAQAFNAKYAHVLFPDKQSVMMEAFPFQPVHRLGDAYFSQLAPELQAYVLYPDGPLRNQAEAMYYPLDTHMTDHGSLVVLRMMLAAVGIDATAALNRIRTRIVKPLRWSGDLGGKFTPKQFQDGLVLDADWPLTELRSPGEFNDGMIDIIFNPEAEHNKTVLLFGDSFFRMMLKQLSAVFSRVICLRTRFLHREMLALIRPDIVFTGNAERYLSQVVPDIEANAFALYPELRGSPGVRDDARFLRAWQAVTAPESTQALALFAELGFTQRKTPYASPGMNAAPSTVPEVAGLRVLVATHHLYRWGGSELVAIEMVEELRRRGCVVSIYCPFADAGFLDPILGPDTQVMVDPGAPDLSRYDIVYSHHQTLSAVLAHQKGAFPFAGPVPIFVYNHLSPYEQFEFPGPFIEAQMADVILCNSLETKRRLSAFGPPFERAELFPNPAPASFEACAQYAPRSLRSLLSVSNHLPQELAQAFDILQNNKVTVTRIGAPNYERRVTPEDISRHDAVVTIGKTVQYAIRSRRPVYCYDHFGGPGWLVEKNRDLAAESNFSGRSQPQRWSPEMIAKELVVGFPAAFSSSQKMAQEAIASFRLEACVDELLTRILPQIGRHHAIQDALPNQQLEFRRKWQHEADMYKLIDRQFASGNPFASLIAASAAHFRKRTLQD